MLPAAGDDMDALGLALVVGGFAFLVSGLIFLVPTGRKRPAPPERVENDPEQMDRDLPETRRGRRDWS